MSQNLLAFGVSHFVTFRSSSFDHLIPVQSNLVKLIVRRNKTIAKINTTDKKLKYGCAKN